jgi:predicted acyltransferase
MEGKSQGMRQRLASLDAFRGLTVAFMILVNNPGSWDAVYPPLRHADWHGWTPTDLVFPFFLWIVGVAMTLSFASRTARGEPRRKLWRHAALRGVALFLIGFALNLVPRFDWEHVRIMGVLQRIGLCYIAGAALYLMLGIRGQVTAVFVLLLGYWALMTQVPVPGFGAGNLEKIGNTAEWIDSQLLAGHMWSQSKVWDPEGLLSTLPAVANVLLGALAGALLRSGNVYGIAGFGGLMTVIALFWDHSFPINKPLWTSSYVFLTCGLASIAFYGLWWAIDVRRWRTWARPFEILGMNALAAFVGSGIAARILSQTGAQVSIVAWLRGWAEPVNASLFYALALVSAFLILGWILHRQRIYVRL